MMGCALAQCGIVAGLTGLGSKNNQTSAPACVAVSRVIYLVCGAKCISCVVAVYPNNSGIEIRLNMRQQ